MGPASCETPRNFVFAFAGAEPAPTFGFPLGGFGGAGGFGTAGFFQASSGFNTGFGGSATAMAIGGSKTTTNSGIGFQNEILNNSIVSIF